MSYLLPVACVVFTLTNALTIGADRYIRSVRDRYHPQSPSAATCSDALRQLWRWFPLQLVLQVMFLIGTIVLTVLLASSLGRKLLLMVLAAAATLAVWIYIDHLRRSLAESSAAAVAAQGKAEAAEALLALRDRQHQAVMAAVAQERRAVDERERALRDARARLDRLPVDAVCPTPAVLDEALDIIGGTR